MRLFTFLILMLIGFSAKQVFAQKSGIRGVITYIAGNQMPGPGFQSKSIGIKRKIYIFQAFSISIDKVNNGFIEMPSEKPIRVSSSNKKGKFKVKLKPGTYSVLIEEKEGKLWGNVFDGQGFINPVKVEKGKFAKAEILINYNASY